MIKCPKCGNEFKEVKKKVKLKVVILTSEDEEFIKESNKIEREYSQEAFEDACEAYRWAYQNIGEKIDINYIKKIHKILLTRLNKRIAGKIRDCDVWVGNRKCLDPEKVDYELKSLCISQPVNPKDYDLNATNELAVKAWHVDFEKIHPFEDGNGRVGRILMNIQRLKMGLPILIIHEGKEQQEYYKWFKEKDRSQNRRKK